MIEPVNGNKVIMKATNPLHFGDAPKAGRASDDISGSFADVLNGMLGKVNNLQVDSENVMKKMITEPESVDVHSVMIASQKAEVALTFTKTVRDEVIRAYRELINLR